MRIGIQSFYLQTVSSFIEVVLPSMTVQQKKIGVIVAVALSFLSACYALFLCFRWRAKSIEQSKRAVSLLEKGGIPLEKKLELAKQAGCYLTKLDLSDSDVSDEQLKQLFSVCPNIRELNLCKCEKLTDASMKNLPQRLESLNVSLCFGVTDATIESLPRGLKFLNLSCCFKITDASIKKLPEGLQEIHLSFCLGLTTESLKDLPKELRALDLRQWNTLKDDDIAILPRRLNSLILFKCIGLTDAAIPKLPKGLFVLDIRECKFTKAALEDLSPNIRLFT